MVTERLRQRFSQREPAECALVTGASGGIGEAFVRALPIETRVVMTGRDEAKLDLLRAELGPRASVVTADLATEAGVESVRAAAEEAGVDLLVNNAGLGAVGDFLDVDFEAHRTALRVNVEAALALTHALLPAMIDRADMSGRRAGVINVASSAAFVPVPRFATYAASKALLLSFTEALAGELSGKPVDVLVACPGAVRTGFGERAGFSGGSVPGAMSPEKVARASLSALGRQTTVVIGPVSATTFGGVALARSVFGQAFARAGRAIGRVEGR